MITVSWAFTAMAASIEVNPGDDIVALTASLAPGSEIVFGDGVYSVSGPLQWTGLGTESEPIVLRAAANSTPVIELAEGWRIASVSDATWIRIEGLTFRGSTSLIESEAGFGGVSIEDSSNIVFRGCVISDIQSTALSLQGDNSDLTIDANEIHHTTDGTGIYVGCGDASCWTQNSTIDGNYVHDIGGEWTTGILLEPGSQNISVSDNVVHTLIGRAIQAESTEYGERNRIEGNAIWDAGEGLGLFGAALVRNNLIFDIIGRGIRSNTDGERVLENLVISFNTVANTGDWGVDLDNWAGHDGMVFANNVVANPTGYAVDGSEAQIDASNRLVGNVFTGLVRGFDEFPEAYVPGGGLEDFADAANDDYYPDRSSPLFNGADPASESWVPEVDFNGTSRSGDAPDVGAYEYSGSTNPGWVVSPGFKEISGNTTGGVDVGGCCSSGKNSASFFLFPLGLWWRRQRRSAGR